MTSYGAWQPIETAGDRDKLGCIVAAWCTMSKKWVVGEAHISNDQWFWANLDAGDYAAESLPSAGFEPRYLMPLPLPPVEE